MIMGCCFFLFLSFDYVVVLKTTYHQYQTITDSLVSLKKTMQFKNNQFITLQRDFASNHLVSQMRFPRMRMVSLDETLNNMLNICTSTGVFVDAYTTLADKKHAGYIERSMSIVLKATLEQLIGAFNQIKAHNLPISFHDFVVSSAIDLHKINNKKVTLRLSMKSYEFIASQQPLKLVTALNSSDVADDPFLAHVALDALYFVGILSQDKTTWALIKKPDGSIVRVLPGDVIGREHAKVVLITKQWLRIQQNTADDAHSIKKIRTLRLK